MDINNALEIQSLKRRVGVIALKLILAFMMVNLLAKGGEFVGKLLIFLISYGFISIFGFFVKVTKSYIVGIIVGLITFLFFINFFEKTNTNIQGIASIAFCVGGALYDVMSMLKLYKLTKGSTGKTETPDDNQKAS
ncbi:MAG: hypothetical protein J5802_04080 [Butyrivibrio sp.]|nr:hypothetical protein [Butyrivibrio sp.]